LVTILLETGEGHAAVVAAVPVANLRRVQATRLPPQPEAFPILVAGIPDVLE
jgi:hypothetical protein